MLSWEGFDKFTLFLTGKERVRHLTSLFLFYFQSLVGLGSGESRWPNKIPSKHDSHRLLAQTLTLVAFASRGALEMLSAGWSQSIRLVRVFKHFYCLNIPATPSRVCLWHEQWRSLYIFLAFIHSVLLFQEHGTRDLIKCFTVAWMILTIRVDFRVMDPALPALSSRLQIHIFFNKCFSYYFCALWSLGCKGRGLALLSGSKGGPGTGEEGILTLNEDWSVY